MDAQHNGERRFNGLAFSFERSDSGATKASGFMSPDALMVLVIGAGMILGDRDLRERLLDAVPALAERVGGRLVAAA